MAGRVNDQQAGNFEVKRAILIDNLRLLSDCIDRKISCTNLLRDTSGLTLLNISLSDFVKKFSLSCIDMAQDTTYGRSKIFFRPCSQRFLMLFLPSFGSYFFFLGKSPFGSCGAFVFGRSFGI